MNNSDFEYDPAYLNALRELKIMACFGALSLLWTIGYCSLYAYQTVDQQGAQIPMTWGIPSWVVWGIALPWATSGLFTICFALFYIKEDDADLLAAEAAQYQSHAPSENPSS